MDFSGIDFESQSSGFCRSIYIQRYISSFPFPCHLPSHIESIHIKKRNVSKKKNLLWFGHKSSFAGERAAAQCTRFKLLPKSRPIIEQSQEREKKKDNWLDENLINTGIVTCNGVICTAIRPHPVWRRDPPVRNPRLRIFPKWLFFFFFNRTSFASLWIGFPNLPLHHRSSVTHFYFFSRRQSRWKTFCPLSFFSLSPLLLSLIVGFHISFFFLSPPPPPPLFFFLIFPETRALTQFAHLPVRPQPARI